MEPIVFRAKRGRLLLNLAGALGFVAMGIFLLIHGRGAAIAWMSILFFGCCAAVFVGQLLDTRARDALPRVARRAFVLTDLRHQPPKLDAPGSTPGEGTE